MIDEDGRDWSRVFEYERITQMKYVGPFCVVPMPVDAKGRGPIFDKSRVVKTFWEVWDQNYLSESSHESKEAAEARAEALNNSNEIRNQHT